jgi:hypothetical protein
MQDKRHLMLFALQLPGKIKLPKPGKHGRTEAWIIEQAQAAYKAAGHLLDCYLSNSFIHADGSVNWTSGVGCYKLEVTKEKLVLLKHRKMNSYIKAPIEVTTANLQQWKITGNWHESMAELTNTTVNKTIQLKIWAADQAVISRLDEPSTPPSTRSHSPMESAENGNFQAQSPNINSNVSMCG